MKGREHKAPSGEKCCYLSISQLPVAISRLSSKVNLTRLPSNSGTCTLSSYVEDNMKLTCLPSNSGFDTGITGG